MATAAFPLAGGNPVLVKEKPFERPGNDRIGDILIRSPLTLRRIVDAKPGKFRWIAMRIDVLRCLSRAARIGSDRRINHDDADARIGKRPAFEEASREIEDADTVGLAYGSQRPFPDADPAGMQHKLKFRAFCPKPPVLLFNGKGPHFCF